MYRPRKKRRKIHKKKAGLSLLVLTLLAVSVFLVYMVLNSSPQAPPAGGDAPGNGSGDRDIEPDIREAMIIAVGDVIVHGNQLQQAFNAATGKYDFSPSFEFIARYIKEADLAVANLETTFGGPERGHSGDHRAFNTPDEMAYNLKEAGFDLLTTANNHSLDTGSQGLYRTLEVIEKAGLKSLGTYRTPAERDTPLIKEVNGIKIGFLNYTDSTNGIPIPAGKDYIINFINIRDGSPAEYQKGMDLIRSDIRRTRESGADLVFVFMHWDFEYRFTASEYQQKAAREIAEAGADAIIGGHPHVIQPMEYINVNREDGSTQRVFVAYSMGNFISNQFHWPGYIPTEEVKYGLMLRLKVSKDMHTGKASLDDVDYIITWVNRDWRHRVLPLHEVIAAGAAEFNIPEPKYSRLEPVWQRTTERLSGFQPAYKPR